MPDGAGRKRPCHPAETPSWQLELEIKSNSRLEHASADLRRQISEGISAGKEYIRWARGIDTLGSTPCPNVAPAGYHNMVKHIYCIYSK